MTRDRSVDERIRQWLLEEAPDQLPDRVLQATFERTRPSRQRRTFLGWRPNPMRSTTTAAIAVGAAAIVLLVVGVTQLPRSNPSVGARPSPSPSESRTADPTRGPSPTLAPISLEGQIAFVRTVDGNADIYLMNLDRTGLVRLTDDPATDSEPSWASDGQQLAFTRGSGGSRDVYLMNADGSGEIRLTSSADGEEAPSISPDGSQVAFLRYRDPTFFDLYVIGVDGSGERRVFHQEGPYATRPIWSPDGRALYFGIDTPATHRLDVARLDLASGNVTLLTDYDGDDSTFALSPDGSAIAFQSDRAPGGIFLMDADGTNVRHLTGEWLKGYPLTWSPDGRHLAYSMLGGWIYLVSTDGGEVTKWIEGGLGVAWRPEP